MHRFIWTWADKPMHYLCITYVTAISEVSSQNLCCVSLHPFHVGTPCSEPMTHTSPYPDLTSLLFQLSSQGSPHYLASSGSFSWFLWLKRPHVRVLASHTIMQFHVTKAIMVHHSSFDTSQNYLLLHFRFSYSCFLHSVPFLAVNSGREKL